MSRFYNTFAGDFLDNMVYKPDYRAMAETVALKQAENDMLKAKAKELFNIQFNYLNTEQEELSAKNIQNYYKEKAGDLIRKIQSDPVNAHVYEKDLDDLRNQLVYDKTQGPIANLEGSYNAFHNWQKENQKLCEEDPIHCENMRRNAMTNWGGNSMTRRWNQEKMLKKFDQKEFEDQINKMVADIKHDLQYRNEGYVYKIFGTEKKYLTEDRIREYAINKILGDNNMRAYLQQAHKVGTGNYFDDFGNFNLYQTEVVEVVNPKTGKKEIVERQVLNDQNSLAPFIKSLSQMAYEQEQKTLKLHNNEAALENLRHNNKRKEIEEEERRNILDYTLGVRTYSDNEVKSIMDSEMELIQKFGRGNTGDFTSDDWNKINEFDELVKKQLRAKHKDFDDKRNYLLSRGVSKYVVHAVKDNPEQFSKLYEEQLQREARQTIKREASLLDVTKGTTKDSQGHEVYEYGFVDRNRLGDNTVLDKYMNTKNNFLISDRQNSERAILRDKKHQELTNTIAKAVAESDTHKLIVGPVTMYNDNNLRKDGTYEIDPGYFKLNREIQKHIKESGGKFLEEIIASSQPELVKNGDGISYRVSKDKLKEITDISSRADFDKMPDQISITIPTKGVRSDELNRIRRMNETPVETYRREHNLASAEQGITKQLSAVSRGYGRDFKDKPISVGNTGVFVANVTQDDKTGIISSDVLIPASKEQVGNYGLENMRPGERKTINGLKFVNINGTLYNDGGRQSFEGVTDPRAYIYSINETVKQN